ncbi:MAG: tRNA pseudouridine38-40 synthase [Crocinitomicaceae bacterium]|jgi:tRNA pseudouridine38-40 synthase
MKWLVHIGYNGSNYSGWQFQPNVASVQGVIEEKLKAIFKIDISVVGCGRTDAGVHASQYMLHFTLEESFDFNLKFRLNKHLPNEIVVYDVIALEKEQHCRFDAVSRTYDYFIHLYKDPFLSQCSSFYELEDLNFDAMKKAAAMLPEFDDFKSVCRQPDLYKHTLCKVSQARFFVDAQEKRLRFTITANRFLRGMVRIIVDYLLQIGSGSMSLEEFKKMLSNEVEIPEKHPALPNGLYLSHVEYTYLNVESQPDIGSFLKLGLED